MAAAKREISKIISSVWLMSLSIGVFLFYFIGNILLTNVYKFAVVGAVFELLWLPALLLLLIIPIASIIFLLKGYGKIWQLVLSLIFWGFAIIVLIA